VTGLKSKDEGNVIEKTLYSCEECKKCPLRNLKRNHKRMQKYA
jgi:hypothetical protein